MELTGYQKTIQRDKTYDYLKKFSEKKGASKEDIDWVEKKLGFRLPTEYSDFLQTYGGGAFARGLILPVDQEEDETEPWDNLFDLYHQNVFEDEGVFTEDYVTFFYDESGNSAGFKVNNGKCGSSVWTYHHETNKWKESYDNFFEFLLNHF